jgi:hypothetical protein
MHPADSHDAKAMGIPTRDSYVGINPLSMDKMSFFTMIAALAASAGVVIWSFNRPLKVILQG